ncbi:MAG: hypothetical protein QM633_09540, partial [Propionicimonas sp.]
QPAAQGPQPAGYPGSAGPFPSAQAYGQAYPGQPGAPYPGAPQPGQAPYPGAPQPAAQYLGTAQPGPQYPGAAQPGQPYPGQPYPGQPVPGPAPAKPSKVRLWVTLGIVGILVVGGVIAGLLSFNVSATKVGDCLAQDGTDSVKSVQCDSGDADYQVVGVIPNTNQPIRGLSNPCEDYSDATSYYWEGREGSSGTLLCLKEL